MAPSRLPCWSRGTRCGGSARSALPTPPTGIRTRGVGAGLCLGFALVVPWPQGAPTTLRLGAPSAALDAEFVRIAGMRELADGRVLMADEAEKRLLVGDWKSRSVRPIGREGQGPGEYERPRNLFALAADSSLLVDALAGRWLLLAGDSIVETVPSSAPAILAGARNPLGADALGFVVATRPMGLPARGRGPLMPPRRDSLHLVRIDLRTGEADTLATVAARPGRINVSGPVDAPTRVEIVTNPLSVGDQVAVFPDGWTAVARVAPYAVDWISPAGRVVRGSPLPFERHAVTEREKRAVLQRQADERGVEPREPSTVQDWPETLPPFLVGGTLPAADGSVWIRRTLRAEDIRAHYDIVTRAGALVARLELRPGEHVIATTRAWVYVVATDADGIQRVLRYPLPGLRSN